MSETLYSDTRGPILMKLWEYIELTLNWYNVKFPTSVAGLKPEVGQFFENQKFLSSKPEVAKYLIPYESCESHHDHFCPGMSRMEPEVENMTLYQFRII